MVPCRIAIQQLFMGDPKPRTPRQVIEALRTTFPGEWTEGTIRAHLMGLSTNHPSARHYPHLQTFAFLTQTPDGLYAIAADAAGKLGELEATAVELTPRKLSRRKGVRTDRRSRMAERIEDLSANFGHYLKEFERRAVFGGPSVHFHVRAIDRRMTHESVRSAIADEELLELIYAMLTAWGTNWQPAPAMRSRNPTSHWDIEMVWECRARGKWPSSGCDSRRRRATQMRSTTWDTACTRALAYAGIDVRLLPGTYELRGKA
jgi:hypothetical protein